MQDAENRPCGASKAAVRYCLRTLGSSCLINITADEFHSIKQAMQNLFTLLDTEEKFGMIIDNFLEYEQELLNLALEDMAWHRVQWSEMRGALALVNRRLANVLTVARLYLDHIKHDVSAMYGGTGGQLERIIEATRSQYDGRLGYRLMESLRNILQHRSFPIASMTLPKNRDERGGQPFIRHRVAAQIRLTNLEKEPKFKKSLLAEVKGRGEDGIDIGPLLREYIEGLSLVHLDLRLATDNDMRQWHTTVLAAVARCAELSRPDPDPVLAYALNSENITVDEVNILCDGLDELRQWRDRTLPTCISQWFVSDGPE